MAERLDDVERFGMALSANWRNIIILLDRGEGKIKEKIVVRGSNIENYELTPEEYGQEVARLPTPRTIRRRDRYETFLHAREDPMIKGKYWLYEKDSTKGTRMTILNSETGETIKERKWEVGQEITP